MFLEAVARYRDQVRADLEAAVAEEVGARDIATSFAVGTFVTMLPTLGTGLVVLGALVAIVERANGPAMFASVAVFNPFVKLGVYAGSFSLGSLLLGPVPGVTAGAVSLSAGSEVLARLVVGNLFWLSSSPAAATFSSTDSPSGCESDSWISTACRQIRCRGEFGEASGP